ncbi:hypothetical protein BKA70DRAFT_610851 [Coprinopsis sp. MPI-PUGE-AT-0042]|nr:hypothetical protein BKA70DRAFT_622969 [Coprinopsis sp. MPI-PUGE-AT-0042]KAH6903087.1 hypothetical protein BKA70DRAFT_610851 [Coprinopsis sp. MPI-PUGE-AT-0042]
MPALLYLQLYALCSIISTHTIYVVVGYSLIFYSAIVTIVLSVWLGLVNYRSIGGSLLPKVFYRDGIFYFIVIAGLFLHQIDLSFLKKSMFHQVMAVMNGVTAARLPVSLSSNARMVYERHVNPSACEP